MADKQHRWLVLLEALRVQQQQRMEWMEAE